MINFTFFLKILIDKYIIFGGLHASLPNKNLQGNYFFKVFSHWCGRLYMLGGIFFIDAGDFTCMAGKREK